MRLFVLVFIVIVLLLGCADCSRTAKDESVISETVEHTREILIDVLDTWPEEIDGCSCYYGRDKDEFSKKTFIYIDNFGDLSYMRIDGQLEKFHLTKADTLSSLEDLLEVWTNDDFEVTIEKRQIDQVDETWQYTGKLTVKSESGILAEEKIYGECGC